MSCVDLELAEYRVSGMYAPLGRLRRWWQAIQDWRSRQITVDMLYSLDDRTLRDIGIDRSEIASLASSNDRLQAYDRFGRSL